MRAPLLLSLAALATAVSLVAAAPKVDRLRSPMKDFVKQQKMAAASKTAVLAADPPANSTATTSATSATSPLDADFAPTVAAAKKNIWASLSNDEAAGVISFLHNQTSLNLTASDNATAWDNAITVIDLLAPNKTDALAYMDGSATPPPRYAVVSIAFGATEEPYIEDIGVGPLPVSGETKIISLDWLSTKGSARVFNYGADSDAWGEWFIEIGRDISDITQDLINGTVGGPDGDDFAIWGVDPLWHENGRTVQWLGFWGNPSSDAYAFDGQTLLPQGLYFKADTTGRDPEGWSVVGWYYNDQFFPSTEAFRKAWQDGTLRKAEQINSLKVDGEGVPWYGTDRTGDPLPLDERLPPVMVAPEGRRFSVDEAERYVEWQGFSFYLGFTRDTGVRLYDIRYDGRRIMYELGLQEAVAHYAGSDPVQSGTSYLDSYYGFGPYTFELVSGYDCPSYATFLNTTFHALEQSRTHRNSLCLFEQDANLPMQRHSTGSYVSVTKNIALILRQVSTVGNYDYTQTFSFYQDGSIEVKVSASGYIQSAFYAANDEYGYQIRQGLSGSMHDHVLNFKADLDILGTKNSIAKHAVVPVEVEYPWSNGTTRNEMKLVRSYIDNEDQAKLDWGGGTHAMFMVVNKDERNAFGEPMGYRLMPLIGNGHSLTIKESPNLYDSAGFTQHHWYVTRQKDTEPRVAHAMNAVDPQSPIVDFSKFLDGESLDQEDLVVWFNLGMVHVPHTGDLPNTVQTTAQASMMISPHNYLASDPSRRSRQQVRIDYSDKGRADEVVAFGSPVSLGADATYPIGRAFPELEGYAGDEVTRKFPYDPLHPFNQTIGIV